MYLILAFIVSLFAVSCPLAAQEKVEFFVSVENSLRFFKDAASQRQHIRDYCLYMRCAGSTDGKTGQEPEGICSGVIAAEAAKHSGNACSANRIKKLSGATYWAPTTPEGTYKTIWDSSSFRYQIDANHHQRNKRRVEFEVPAARTGDQCSLTLSSDGTVLWTERLPNCRSNLKRDLELSDKPYTLSGTLLRGSTLIEIPVTSFKVRHMTVLALGDSIAAGEGLPHRLYADTRNFLYLGHEEPGAWLERRCHRSFFNYSLMAMALAAESERTLSIDYFNYACSGARLLMPSQQRPLRQDEGKTDPCKAGDGGILDRYSGFWCLNDMLKQARRFAAGAMDGNTTLKWLEPQINDAKATLSELEKINGGEKVRPDYVIISIGGNDVLFGGLLLEALFKDGCKRTLTSRALDAIGSGPGKACIAELANARKAELPSELLQLGRAVDELNPRRVLLVGYLDPTKDARGVTCGKEPNLKSRLIGPSYLSWISATVSATEAENAYKNILQPLNDLLSEFASSKSRPDIEWIYVNPNSTANAGIRGWCATPSWFTTYDDSQARQGDPGGTAHPNIYGQNSLSYTVRCHMAQQKTLDPMNVCKGPSCNCAVAAPASAVKPQ